MSSFGNVDPNFSGIGREYRYASTGPAPRRYSGGSRSRSYKGSPARRRYAPANTSHYEQTARLSQSGGGASLDDAEYLIEVGRARRRGQTRAEVNSVYVYGQGSASAPQASARRDVDAFVDAVLAEHAPLSSPLTTTAGTSPRRRAPIPGQRSYSPGRRHGGSTYRLAPSSGPVVGPAAYQSAEYRQYRPRVGSGATFGGGFRSRGSGRYGRRPRSRGQRGMDDLFVTGSAPPGSVLAGDDEVAARAAADVDRLIAEATATSRRSRDGGNDSTSSNRTDVQSPPPSAAYKSSISRVEAESQALLSNEVKAALKTPEFNMWEYSQTDLMYLIEEMYVSLGFVEDFDVDRGVLWAFLNALRTNYNTTPFHNFYHCFCVSQMVYCILCACADRPATAFIKQEEQFLLLVAANCHDLRHPGLNNAYHINSGAELALRYNDASVLENYHCSEAFRLLRDARVNVLSAFSDGDEFKAARKKVIKCILATDMAQHFAILGDFDKKVADESLDWESEDDRTLVMQIILMCADISNEVRPWEVSFRWAGALLEEFFRQSDREKEEGLPVLPFMDRDQVNQEESQAGFIGFILRPLWVSAAKLLEELSPFVERIDENYATWIRMMEERDSLFLMEAIDTEEQFAHITPRHVAAGEVIMVKGETSTEMYFLKEGEVVVYGDDINAPFSTLGPGSIFGEIVAFRDVTRTANIAALSDCVVYAVEREDVHALLERYPEQGKHVKAVADERFVITQRIEAKFDTSHLVEMGG